MRRDALMATIERPARTPEIDPEWFDEEGFPWLENGERMNQEEFHERDNTCRPGSRPSGLKGWSTSWRLR